MNKLVQLKNIIINLIFPVASKRRLFTQFIYRLLTKKESLKYFNNKRKEEGIIKALKKSYNKLVIINSRENQEEKYEKYIQKNTLTEKELEEQKNTEFEYTPLISIITPLYNTKKEFFEDYYKSIINQTYYNYEICLVDASDNELSFVKEIIKENEKVKYKRLNENKGISENNNEALKMAEGEFVTFIDHDDIIDVSALYEVVKKLNEDKNIDFIYTDEDKFEQSLKNRYYPFFKPDFSPDFLRSNNYICHLSVIRKSLIDLVGNFKSKFDGAQDYDLFLRITEKTNNIVHIPKVLYHWRVHSFSTAQDFSSKMYAIDAGKEAIYEHCKRLKLNIDSVEIEKPYGLYRTKYKLNEKPLVSIIIPNKDSFKYLKRAINSVLKSSYDNYEIIIVENNSESRKIFKYYEKLKKNAKIKVVNYNEKGFNFSKLNNLGVSIAKGEYIILLNNDIKVINNNWIEEMLELCQRDDVGIVGAKLLYNDKTVQHAGVILGMGGIAGHFCKNIKYDNPGYYGRAKVINNFSAVTAACMMVKRKLYEEVNGLDENFKVAFNDIDFCMKIREKGKNIVFTPYAKLYHYESKSRGYEDTPEKKKRFQSEIDLFKKKWKKQLDDKDPYFNINLDLYSEQCEIIDFEKQL